MRTFVAVDVGSRISEGVAELAARLREHAERCGRRVSWTRPEGWHVTLKFLGEISETAMQDVAARLQNSLDGRSSFPVSARGLALLPAHKPPRVLAVDVDGGGALEELAETVEAALEPAGFARERRRFRPHLTIGRVREAGGWRRFERRIESLRDCYVGDGEVTSVELYESEVGQGGSRYTVLGRFALRPDASRATAFRTRADCAGSDER